MLDISIIICFLFVLFIIVINVKPKLKKSYEEFGNKHKLLDISIGVIFVLSVFKIISSNTNESTILNYNKNSNNKIDEFEISRELDRNYIENRISDFKFKIENNESNEGDNFKDSINNLNKFIDSSNLYIQEKDSFKTIVKELEKDISSKIKEKKKNEILDCIIDNTYHVWGGDFTFFRNGQLSYYTPPLFNLPRYYQYGTWKYIGGNRVKIFYENSPHILKIKKGCIIDSDDFFN